VKLDNFPVFRSKKTGIIHFCRKTSQNTNFPIWPSKSLFFSKTSLYRLK
jgi:hypothetical protein